MLPSAIAMELTGVLRHRDLQHHVRLSSVHGFLLNYYPTSCSLPSCHFIQRPFVTVHSHWHIIFFKLYVMLKLCNEFSILFQNFVAWDNTMSSDDESTTTQPEPKYQLRSNTQSFKSIFLSSWSSWRYHQVSTAPPSSSTTPTKNSGLGYTTSTIHQIPFGGAHQWGMPVTAPTFTPSPYIPL
jgi:hypothetical protein